MKKYNKPIVNEGFDFVKLFTESIHELEKREEA